MIKSKNITALLDEIYKYYNDKPSFVKIIKGEYSKVNRFPDLSFEAMISKNEIRQAYKKKIDDIRESESLSSYDMLALDEAQYFIDYAMFPMSCLVQISCFIEEYYYLTFNIVPYNMPVSEMWDSLGLFDCSTAENVEKHMELTKDYIRFTKQMRDKVFEQARRGIYLFADAIEGSSAVLRANGSVEYENHPLNMKRPGSAASESQIAIEREYIKEANSYLIDIAEFIESDNYREKAPKNFGWGQYDNGVQYYRYLRKYHLDYDIDAKELHDLGLKLFDQAIEKQAKIRKSLGFDCTHEEFLEKLKLNERFYPTTPEKVGELMNGFKNAAEVAMKDYFREVIETPCSIRRMDESLEESMTFGFFIPSYDKTIEGVYFFNGSGLEDKCQINIPALLAHELLPGHHFQQSFVNESKTLHPLFKEITTGCYLEGWAEYGAFLMRQIGLFDEYDEYGRLEMDKFGCVRLIVDTGLNELGWSTEKAEEFMVNNTFATPQMAKSEVLRYTTAIPAQCLPYKYGCVKMLELREKYKTAMKDNYNIKDFHSLVLRVGNVPMSLLEKYIEREISNSVID